MFISMSAAVEPEAGEAPAAGLENFASINEYSAGSFADVASSAWYYEDVKTAYELGLLKGSSDTAFNPGGNMTVAEAITLAARIHSIYATGEAAFEQGNPWYEVYVTYAAENQIISEVREDGVAVGSETLEYNAPITRAQFALVFSAVLPADEFEAINEVAAGSIPDVREGRDYAAAVYMLYNAGILTGSDSAGTFKPTSNIQRSEVAAIATRIVDKSRRKTVSLKADENKVPCYEESYATDYGAFMGIAAVYSDVPNGIRRFIYLERDIMKSKYSETPIETYVDELKKIGFELEGYAGDEENPVLVYTDGTECVLVATTVFYGESALIIALAPYDRVFVD